jgi:hypothetical protein
VKIAVEREGGQVSVFEARIHGSPEMLGADEVFIERVVKTLLWAWGGWRVIIGGSGEMATYLENAYRVGGAREFDAVFMSKIYEKSFTVESRALADVPNPAIQPKSIGRHLDGCRIGFDAGGSDRKVSAVIDGGGALHLDAIPADIRLRAEVTADGRCFQLVMAGDRTNARRLGTVTPECAVEAVTELLKTIAVEGSAARARDVCAPNLPRKGEVESARLAAEPIGTHALRDASVALGLGLPFGHSDADTLQSLIEEARRAGARA